MGKSRAHARDKGRTSKNRSSCTSLDAEDYVGLLQVPSESPELLLEAPEQAELGGGDLVRRERSVDDFWEGGIVFGCTAKTWNISD